MGDTNFSSLLELVNSHLSKTSLSNPTDEEGAFPLASVSIQTGKSQTIFTPPNGIMSIPRIATHDNEINGILAQQVTNMLIAKEKKKQEEEEKQRHVVEQIQQIQLKQKDDYVIDLMSSIITPGQILDRMLPKSLPDDKAPSAGSSEFETMLNEITDFTKNEERVLRNTVLPLNQDLSYILLRKVKRGKPSAFGKVISSRMRPVAAPYLRLNVCNSQVKQFDFSTKSPCDINLEKRRHPPHDPYAHMNMVERFMAQTNNATMQNM